MSTVHINLRERSLLERILYGILVLAVLALGFFFVAAALVAGVLLASVILLRYWWLKRKLKKAAEAEFITTEYSLVEREPPVAPSLPRDKDS